MMKRETKKNLLGRVCVCAAMMICICAHALAYDGAAAAGWMEQFAQALTGLSALNDAVQTADPARAGQYLIEYEFGTVLSAASSQPAAADILEIDVRTNQVTDCRGMRVGMTIDEALGGVQIAGTDAQLVVLETQEAGYGWSWAYRNESGVYGLEYIAYDGDDNGMKEYTLTYVIDNGEIRAIRMKAAPATLAQAQDGLETAEEIASRQDRDPVVAANTQPELRSEDLQVMGGQALGMPVAQLIAHMGEPGDIQTLPQGEGRILVYDGAVVRLGFNVETGEEIVRSVSVSNAAITGPRRLTVGMGVSEAAALLRCDDPVFSRGGTLYLLGEASGEPPYGELHVLSQREMVLEYACLDDRGEIALLEVLVQDGFVTNWHLVYQLDAEGGV